MPGYFVETQGGVGAVLFAVSFAGFVPLRRYYGYTDALTNFLFLTMASPTGQVRCVVTIGPGW